MPSITIEQVVLRAIADGNRARDAAHQLEVSPVARLFGGGSPLDSLGLVALLMDVEDGLREIGLELDLSDAHAMSVGDSPFRDVPSLVGHIERLAQLAS